MSEYERTIPELAQSEAIFPGRSSRGLYFCSLLLLFFFFKLFFQCVLLISGIFVAVTDVVDGDGSVSRIGGLRFSVDFLMCV